MVGCAVRPQNGGNGDSFCGTEENHGVTVAVGVEIKVKALPKQATKAQRVSRGIALPFHDLGA